MVEIAPEIELNIPERLRDDPEFRRAFFLAEASAEIAAQLVTLRERRGVSQGRLAETIGTQQPAISRAEKADYQNWSFNTLRRIAGALDARIRVLIQPSEDVLNEYDKEDQSAKATSEASDIGLLEQLTLGANASQLVNVPPLGYFASAFQGGALDQLTSPSPYPLAYLSTTGLAGYAPFGPVLTIRNNSALVADLRAKLAAKERELAARDQEIARMRNRMDRLELAMLANLGNQDRQLVEQNISAGVLSGQPLQGLMS